MALHARLSSAPPKPARCLLGLVSFFLLLGRRIYWSVPASITIDRRKHLDQEPHTGHNRWHPDLVPVVEVDAGETVALETRDALDGNLNASSTVADFAALPLGAIHPLTGPVFVKGASPGDLLEVEFVDIAPQPWAFSAIMPGWASCATS